VKDQFARPRVDSERGDAVYDGECQQHALAISDKGINVADNMPANPKFADTQNLNRVDAAIG
jgi:hypothetical protein